MSDFLLSFQGSSQDKMHVLSLGCGNAAVEGLLIGEGHAVDALDVNEEAVSYARKKGVNAQVCDLLLWSPQVEKYDLVYCDGIFGHLLDGQEGFRSILTKIKKSLKQGGVVVISNDSSQISEDVQPHPAVPGFFWFTDKYLASQLESCEFKSIKTSHYLYKRPISGERNRLVAMAYKG
jgi:SAM-dependent methyltransferase